MLAAEEHRPGRLDSRRLYTIQIQPVLFISGKTDLHEQHKNLFGLIKENTIK